MRFLDRLRGRPTRDDFAAMMTRAIRRAGEVREVRYGPAEFRLLTLEGGRPAAVTNLGNMYANYLAAPRARRRGCLATFAGTATAADRGMPADFAAARPNLRPKVWTRAGIEAQRLRIRLDGMSGRGLDPTCVPLGEHLLACVAYDWPEATRSISDDVLEGWGVTIYEAMEAATQALDESTAGYATIGEELASFIDGDSYDASRILLLDRIASMGLAGRPIAMVPNRDTALVAGEDDEAALGIMAAMAEEALGRQYHLSGVPLVLDDGAWERVREVAGGLMEQTEHYPPRYRVRGFPDAAALEAIGKGEL
jgi:hypothetical protein